MVSAKRSSIEEHDSPVDSFFNSLHVVRESLIPIESGIQRAAIDLQSHWLGSQNFDSHKKSSSIRVPSKSFWGSVFQKKGLKERENRDNEDGLCSNCLGFAVSWSLMINSFMQTIPSPFKSVKKCFQKQCSDGDDCLSSSLRIRVSPSRVSSNKKQSKIDEENKNGFKEGEVLSLEILLGFLFDNLFQNLNRLNQSNRAKNESKNTEQELGFLFDRLFQNLNRLNQSNRAKNEPKNTEQELGSKNDVLNDSSNQFNPFEVFASVLKGRKADVDCLLVNLGFAKMGGVPGLVGVASVKDDCQDNESGNREQESSSALKVGAGLLQIPLSNVERLKSTLSTVSLAEMVELVTQLGRTSKDYPDKKKLFSVQDFFRYTQAEGRRFFEELDRDGDGQVTLEDLEIAMRKRRLPHRYAREFLRRTRSHLFAKSFGWRQFLSLMEQKEPTILRAYTTLCLSKSGTLQKSQILASLQDAGLPANEENVMAMMRCLDAETEGSISYGHFRNFMLLLPSERLEDDPRSIWFEAATVVAVAPPVEIPAGSVLKSALAGGLASALSTSLMHPVDTMKTRVQASTLSFPELVSNLPQIGLKGLYRGCIPAVLGQFSSHGLRTGIYEASKLLLINIAPSVSEIQAQSLASFCSTILGTAVRIPCEVLKQRLQAGIFNNVGEAIVGTFQQDGIKGFFRGTGATLCREVPFYVAGMGLYEESKKAAQRLLRRDLEPWETIAVGALSGGLAAVVTTPFDVMKTRMMTAPQGVPVTMTVIAFSILRNEGPLGLLKGAVPRFFWIAPLGAMNFAGYELAKKAMNKTECLGTTNDHLREKKLAKAG